MSSKVLLAVLGRGCMMQSEDDPTRVPTEDFDWWKLGTKRPDVITVPPDTDENCVIGGGQLNLAAAEQLYMELGPEEVVFAYGNRSEYLALHGYESESESMSAEFRKIMTARGITPRIDVFDEKEWDTTGSSSYQEVHNILVRALALGMDEVIFLTVMVHMNRVMVMVVKHLNEDPEFVSLRGKVRFEVAESVLLRTDAKHYAERVLAIFGSQAYLRNLERELNGSRAMYKGVTQITQPGTIVAPAR